MWLDIEEYKGMYQINEDGQVKRLGISKHGIGNKDRMLKQEINNCGYLRVTLCKNNKPKRYLTHKLVYKTFVEDIPKGLTINHKDLNKNNNNINNLEVKTQHENNQLKSNTKLDKSKVIAIRKSKLSSRQLAEIYQVAERTIQHVLIGDRWANV